jgi:hypothetical protein
VDSIKVLHDRMLAPEAESPLADAGRLSAEQASRCQNIGEELREEVARLKGEGFSFVSYNTRLFLSFT